MEKQRQLLVFLDGTSNQWRTRSNVRRLFEVVAAQEDPTRVCFYSEGVGTAGSDLFGKALGYGLKERTMLAYEFLKCGFRAHMRTSAEVMATRMTLLAWGWIHDKRKHHPGRLLTATR